MLKWRLQKSNEDIIACDKKSKDTQNKSLSLYPGQYIYNISLYNIYTIYICILGNMYKGVDDCGLSTIVENAICLCF